MLRETRTLLESLGFLISVENSVLEPAQSLEYSGLVVDTLSMTSALSQKKKSGILRSCREALAAGRVSLRSIAKIRGVSTGRLRPSGTLRLVTGHPLISPSPEVLIFVVLFGAHFLSERSGGGGALFIGSSKTHHPVTSSTVGRWIKDQLKEAGVDTAVFSAY